MFRTPTTFSSTLGIFALAFLVASCGDDDNPVDTEDHDEEHAEALGLIIRSSGEEIVRYENGEVDGEIEVGHGKETALLNVRFIAEDGDLFVPDADEDFSLGWEIADEDIAEVEQHELDGPGPSTSSASKRARQPSFSSSTTPVTPTSSPRGSRSTWRKVVREGIPTRITTTTRMSASRRGSGLAEAT